MRDYNNELALMAKAGIRVVEVVSSEYQRVQGFCLSASRAIHSETYIWSVTGGIRKDNGEGVFYPFNDSCDDLQKLVDFVLMLDSNCLVLVENADFMLDEKSLGLMNYVSKIRDFIHKTSSYNKMIVLNTCSVVVPKQLEKEIAILDVELSGIKEAEKLAKYCLKKYGCDSQPSKNVLKAVLGLSEREIQYAFSKAIIKFGRLTDSEIPFLLSEKEEIIRKTGILEFYKSSLTTQDIGGLDVLIDWAEKRKNAFSDEAMDFGLETPKGVVLLGVPGCGKSLMAKTISNEWQFPLLRLDFGSVFNKYVGESESNIRSCLKVAEAVAPCVLWIDEVEKGLSGTKYSSDSGTSSRVFGTFLTWLQEKQKPVFVVVTANDISLLPPELLRKGRFDEIFFVDLPSKETREEIFRIHLVKRGRNPEALGIDIGELARLTEGFSGAEIEQAIKDAMYQAFSKGIGDVSQEDIKKCIVETTPLSTTMASTIQNLRKWCENRAKKASSEEPSSVKENKDIPVLRQESSNPFIDSNNDEQE